MDPKVEISNQFKLPEQDTYYWNEIEFPKISISKQIFLFSLAVKRNQRKNLLAAHRVIYSEASGTEDDDNNNSSSAEAKQKENGT